MLLMDQVRDLVLLLFATSDLFRIPGPTLRLLLVFFHIWRLSLKTEVLDLIRPTIFHGRRADLGRDIATFHFLGGAVDIDFL